ncbi:MAG: FtsX-like permease family protein, partial [Armatimonadetes bacterium]|nr:FtsX-like permease family protein [Armatimonadota bacterium]
MSILRLLLREIQHRKLNFVSAIVAVVVAVTLFVAIVTMCDASRRETVRLMRDMGFNLLIVPENTDMADFWSEDFAREEMPEEYVYRLSNSDLMTVRHLVARLQKKIQWRGRKVLLTGILPEVPMAHRAQKSPMGLTIPQGRAYVGFALARSINIKVGDKLEFGDKQLTVERCLVEKGSKDDIRIYAHLHDVQEIMGKSGIINEIEALNCLCYGKQSLSHIRADIAKILPGTRVTEFKSIAIARAETRRMVENYALFIIPVVVLGTAIWISLLALGNVRERRTEIGVFRAMGLGSTPIAALFLGKAVLVGLIGAAAGFALGTWLALYLGPQIFPLTATRMTPMLSLLVWALVGAPVLCVMASYLPTLHAILQDPAQVLREE